MLSPIRYHMQPTPTRDGLTGNGIAALEHDVDENGSPAHIEPQIWYVCFVPGLKKQWWHQFVSGWQHVFLIRPEGQGNWTIFEPWWTRLLVKTISTGQAVRFLRWASLGEVLSVCEHVPGKGSQLRGWMNCAALAAFLLGRNYRTWSPRSLHRKLRSEPSVCTVNVQDLLVAEFTRVAANETAVISARNFTGKDQQSLRNALIVLGKEVLTMLSQPAVKDLTRSAVAEAYRFPELGEVIQNDLLERCLRAVCAVLEASEERGLIDVHDIKVVAAFFIQSIVADTCFKTTLGLAPAPCSDEIETKVASAVNLLLTVVEVAPGCAGGTVSG